MTGPRNRETPYLADPDFTLYNGDVRQVLASLDSESVHCVVTSPPYWGLRDYGTGTWDGGNPDCDHMAGRLMGNDNKGNVRTVLDRNVSTCRCGARRVDNQLGLESTPDEYLESMVDVFREVRRVLRPDGTCWVNMGDSYAASVGAGDKVFGNPAFNENRPSRAATKTPARTLGGLKPKDLCMIPARLALALQADGWWLRSQIVWSKPNPMPESVTDRPTTSHEYVYLLTRSPRYFFDQEAVREPYHPDGRAKTWISGASQNGEWHENYANREGNDRWPGQGRNIRSVWEIPTQPYPEAHFATYPEELVRRCILAGCPEGGTVLDPFMGSGTTALVARKHGRRSVGVELNPAYCELAARRLSQLSLLAEPAV